MSTATLQQTKRAVNTAAATRHKARRLVVTTINQHLAFVQGDTDEYQVSFDGMTCTCKAGQVGQHCSHVQAAIRERATIDGWQGVLFCATDAEVKAARLELRNTLGSFRSRGYDEHGYRWIVYGRPF
jgi:uncharacterized Fe-S center protein